MKKILFLSFWPIFGITALVCPATAQEKSVVHDPAVHTGSGLNKELFAGVTEANFLKLGDKAKMVKVTLVTAFTDTNSWMNFNGYSHGNATYTIPTGWTVEVTFINPSPSPHSAVVVEREMLRKVRIGEPAFKGASTPFPDYGIRMTKTTFTFTASESGEYAFACGIPAHATAGHWIALNVADEAKMPTLKLGDGLTKDAK